MVVHTIFGLLRFYMHYVPLFVVNNVMLVNLLRIIPSTINNPIYISEIVRIYDGNSTLKRRVYRRIAVLKNTPAQALLVSRTKD